MEVLLQLLVVTVDSFFRSRSTTRVSLSSLRQVDELVADSAVDEESEPWGDWVGCDSGTLATNLSCLRLGVRRLELVWLFEDHIVS